MRLLVGNNEGNTLIDYIETELQEKFDFVFDYDVYRLVLKFKFEHTGFIEEIEEFMTNNFKYPYEYESHNEETNERILKQSGEDTTAIITVFLLPLFPASAVWEHTRINIKSEN